MKLAILVLSATAAAAGTLIGAPSQEHQRGPVIAEVRGEEGEYLVTLRADAVPLERVLEELGTAADFDVEGLTLSSRTVLVTVDLEWRPLEQVLEYMLGSVGMHYRMRRGTITLLDASTDGLDSTALMQVASASYLAAINRYPDHPQAPRARLEQGHLADLQGFPTAAIDHYQSLLDDYPKAPEIPEAYMRSGYIFERLGNWADAAEQFRAVANIPLAKEQLPAARLELARCTAEIGDPQEALFMLTALDSTYPAGDANERGRRELVRALALAGTQRYLDALQAVESVETMLDGEDRIEALRVRAISLQGAGNVGDAARAWMIYALETEEPTRVYALEQAVQLALAAEDEMSALFIVRQAEKLGHGLRFAPFKSQAYERLGFATETPAVPTSGMEGRIGSAEEAVAAGDSEKASKLLADYVPGATALEPDMRVRFAVTWAASLADTGTLEDALAHLRSERAALAGDAHFERRARLDVAAAALLEAREMYDEAADAYRGIY